MNSKPRRQYKTLFITNMKHHQFHCAKLAMLHFWGKENNCKTNDPQNTLLNDNQL